MISDRGVRSISSNLLWDYWRVCSCPGPDGSDSVISIRFGDREDMPSCSYIWAAAGKQPDLEKQLGVGGYGYPALVALNVKKGAYAPLRSAFELDQVM